MLRRTMSAPMSLQLCLDDLLADLRRARRLDDLGRLALIAYCDVRRWARQAREQGIAEQAAAMFVTEPQGSRVAFLAQIDGLVRELERVQSGLPEPSAAVLAPSARNGQRAPVADH